VLQRRSLLVWALAFGLIGPSISRAQVEWAGYLSVEPRVFFDSPAFPEQTDQTFSFFTGIPGANRSDFLVLRRGSSRVSL
jgi:hypothetical protein